MAFSIGDKLMANSDRPGENSSIKKGMKGIVVAKDNSWSNYEWEVSWEEGKFKDRIKGDEPKVTKI
jgi:hypothetical protein